MSKNCFHPSTLIWNYAKMARFHSRLTWAPTGQRLGWTLNLEPWNGNLIDIQLRRSRQSRHFKNDTTLVCWCKLIPGSTTPECLALKARHSGVTKNPSSELSNRQMIPPVVISWETTRLRGYVFDKHCAARVSSLAVNSCPPAIFWTVTPAPAFLRVVTSLFMLSKGMTASCSPSRREIYLPFKVGGARSSDVAASLAAVWPR
jgi:hypothetical protein